MINYAKSDRQKAELAEKILNSKGPIKVEIEHAGTISGQQMRAVHLWFRMLADAMNDAGINVQQALEQRMEIPWTDKLIKELVWRPAMKAFKDKASTTQLYKLETSDVIEVVNRWFTEKQGVYVEFPSEESNYHEVSV